MDVQEDILIGYKREFMPTDIEILLIGKDIALRGEESKYRKLVEDINMYDIKFIDHLDSAFPAIQVKNQFLVITRRVADPEGQGFLRALSGGSYWLEVGDQVKIDEEAYFRELVLVSEGDGREWVMKEYFSSTVIESGEVICSVYLREKSTEKDLKSICDGLAAADLLSKRAKEKFVVSSALGAQVSESMGIRRVGNKEGVARKLHDSDDDDEIYDDLVHVKAKKKGVAKVYENLEPVKETKEDVERRFTRKNTTKARVQVVGTSDGTKTQVDFVDSEEGVVLYNPVVEGPPQNIELNLEENSMSTGEYYNIDDPDYQRKKMNNHWKWKET